MNFKSVKYIKTQKTQRSLSYNIAGILFFILWTGCIGFITPAAGQDIREFGVQYPSWFLTMPLDPEAVYVVGYAPVYAIFDSSVNQAIENAREQLLRAEEVHVQGEQLFQVIPGGQHLYQGELFEELYTDSTGWDVFVLDTVRVENMVLVLVSNMEHDSFRSSFSLPPSQHAPKWVTDVSNLYGSLYAVGISALYFYEQNAWLEGEKQARRQLAFSISARQRQLFKTIPDQEFGVTATSTSVKLFKTQVVERWRNDRMVFVLMRARGFEIVD